MVPTRAELLAYQRQTAEMLASFVKYRPHTPDKPGMSGRFVQAGVG